MADRGAWDWDYAFEILPDLLAGLLLTAGVTLAASALALSLGLGWALIGFSGPRFVRAPLRLLLEFLRGTPLLIQLFFVFFVFPDFGILLSALATGILVLGVHYSAYTAEVYRGGIAAAARGQWEAAVALNLSPARVWRKIILPPAIRRSAPALANYVIALYKETALLFVIGLPVLLLEARTAGTESFRFLEAYTIAGLLYLVVSYPSSILLRRFESSNG